MAKVSYGIKSTRVLLSNEIYHDVRLSERSLGVIAHALAVLEKAFSEEAQYKSYITVARIAIADGVESPVVNQR